jgi:hypothetical protein
MESPRDGAATRDSLRGARKVNDEKFGKGPSHAWDSVPSPCGDMEGPFRGWLLILDRIPRYLRRDREDVERFLEEVLRNPRGAERRARPERR